MPGLAIAIDFDNTITADPELYHRFITDCLVRGHDVRIVTYRHAGGNNMDIALFNAAFNLPVIFTSGSPKWDFCHKLGFKPNIWHDDNPRWIGQPEDQINH